MSKTRRKYKVRRSNVMKKSYLNPNAFSREVKLDIYLRDRGKCLFCGEDNPDVLTCSHHIPKRSGGLGVVQNGYITCGDGSKNNCHHKLDFTEARIWMRPIGENHLRSHYPGWHYDKYIQRSVESKKRKGLI